MGKSKRHLGTLEITTNSGTSVYPVTLAEFGVIKFRDATELWIDTKAAKPTLADAGDQSATWQPRFNGSIFVADLDLEHLSDTELTVPCITDRGDFKGCEFYSNASCSLFSHYGDWEPLGRSVIRLKEGDDETQYHLNWRTSFLGHSNDECEVTASLQAECRLARVTNVPYTLAYTKFMPWYCSYLIWLPLCITAGIAVTGQFGWSWWIGTLIGFFVGNFIGHNLELHWQHRVNRLLAGNEMPKR